MDGGLQGNRVALSTSGLYFSNERRHPLTCSCCTTTLLRTVEQSEHHPQTGRVQVEWGVSQAALDAVLHAETEKPQARPPALHSRTNGGGPRGGFMRRNPSA